MKIDFNRLRKKIANEYNALYLLSGDIKDKDLKSVFETALEKMRDSISCLLCCESDNEKIKSIDYKLLPIDKDEE